MNKKKHDCSVGTHMLLIITYIKVPKQDNHFKYKRIKVKTNTIFTEDINLSNIHKKNHIGIVFSNHIILLS